MKLFSKSLTRTDVDHRLSVPIKGLESFPCFQGGHAVELRVKDESRRVWAFSCLIRKKNYLKPVLSRGWREFVRSNDLNIGDKVELYMEEDQATEAKYKIKVKRVIKEKREIKLFGVTMSYASVHDAA